MALHINKQIGFEMTSIHKCQSSGSYLLFLYYNIYIYIYMY